MAGRDPSMKVTYTSDSSKFQAGTRDAKRAVQDFQKSTDSALNAVAGAFGVSGQKVSQVTSSIKGLGVEMTKSGNAGVKAFGELVASMDAAKVALAGIGIGAAIAAFEALNRTAKNFKETVAGANIEMATAAYTSAYQQAFFDMDAAQGKSVANFMAGLQKVKAAAGAVGTSLLVNQANDTTTAFLGILSPTFWKGTISNMKEANRVASQAEQIQNRIYELQRKQSDNLVENSEIDQRITDLRNQIADKTLSATVRAQALAEAEDLIRKKYTEQYDIESEIADLMEEQNSLTASTPKQIDAANQQRVKANSLVSQMNSELKSLIRAQNSLTGSVKETTVAISAEAKEMLKVIDAQVTNDLVNRPELQNLGVSGIRMPGATTSQNISLAGYSGEVEQVTRVILDLKSAMSDLAADGAEAIGSLIGDLVNGSDAWSNFGNAALSSLGDMAVAVGKTIMQEGIAVEAAKLSLTTLSGVGAIAAGAALIAIGSALKTSLKNAASGSYSASGSVASSGYSQGTLMSRDYAQREMRVEVTGSIEASGDKLLVAINNTNNRKSHTT